MGFLPGEDLAKTAKLGERAALLRSIYEPKFAFPLWSVEYLSAGKLEKYAKSVGLPRGRVVG